MMQIDFKVEHEGKEILNSYWMAYKTDVLAGRSMQTLFYDPEMNNIRQEQVNNYKAFTETIHENTVEGGETCKQFKYNRALATPQELQDLLWKPRALYFPNAYIGRVCYNNETLDVFNDLHAFISSDVSGKQFTTFFEPIGLTPIVVAYQR